MAVGREFSPSLCCATRDGDELMLPQIRVTNMIRGPGEKRGNIKRACLRQAW